MGGYKIINLNNINITADGATVTGVYESLENNYRKALLLSGVVIENVEYADCYIMATVSDSNFTFIAYGKTFTVDNTDKITVA